MSATLPVFLGMITANTVQLETVNSLLRVVAGNTVETVLPLRSSPSLDDGRNMLIEAFYAFKPECDYLLMVDSDIEFEPWHIALLVDDELPVVSGTYYGTNGRPTAYRMDTAGRMQAMPVGVGATGPPLVEVDGVGAGFLLIRRDVLDACRAEFPLPCQWFDCPVIDGHHYSEDLGFCLRARSLGFPVYIDGRVQVAHYKTIRTMPFGLTYRPGGVA